MPSHRSDLLLRALKRQAVPRTPLWFMRQAGRYLPEYRETRAQAGDFMTLCRTPELACEVTMQPLRRYALDAAILFSDILTIPDAMGLGLSFVEGQGPRFERPLRTPADIAKLGVPDPETDLRYVMDAVRTIRSALADRVPLIGFSGSPWTLASYMVEGRGGHNFQHIKALAYDEPQAMQSLTDTLVQSVTGYLAAQAAAGAQVLMVFDTWGGVLTPAAFKRWSLEPMQRIVSDLKRLAPEVPVILFTKHGGGHLEALAETGADGLGVDWTQGLAEARHKVGSLVTLQGNLDPVILLAKPPAIRAEVQRVLSDFGQGSGHIFNLGHGILPETPPEHVAAMVDAVRELSPAFHGQEDE